MTLSQNPASTPNVFPTSWKFGYVADKRYINMTGGILNVLDSNAVSQGMPIRSGMIKPGEHATAATLPNASSYKGWVTFNAATNRLVLGRGNTATDWMTIATTDDIVPASLQASTQIGNMTNRGLFASGEGLSTVIPSDANGRIGMYYGDGEAYISASQSGSPSNVVVNSSSLMHYGSGGVTATNGTQSIKMIPYNAFGADGMITNTTTNYLALGQNSIERWRLLNDGSFQGVGGNWLTFQPNDQNTANGYVYGNVQVYQAGSGTVGDRLALNRKGGRVFIGNDLDEEHSLDDNTTPVILSGNTTINSADNTIFRVKEQSVGGSELLMSVSGLMPFMGANSSTTQSLEIGLTSGAKWTTTNANTDTSIAISGGFIREGYRKISVAANFTIWDNNRFILIDGVTTGGGTGFTITLPVPGPNQHGRQLTFVENSASTWTSSQSLYRTSGAPLTTISGTVTIVCLDSKWWIIP